MSRTTPSSMPPPGGSLLKRIFIGRAIASSKQEHQLLPKTLALPVFSSDPLSSNAYATEEMMLVLTLAGVAGLSYMLPIAGGIALLLIIVITSYRQTVRAYPRGGGSYIVARENLGTVPGLFAGSAILLDYILTVAVSTTAGTYAVTSAAPELTRYRVPIALGFMSFVMLMNLRGVRESGTLFAVPTYGFVAMVAVTLVTGFVRCLGGCPQAASANVDLEVIHPISLFILARAFSSGATALTGVEAIADGVQAFRRPQARNAAATLGIMGVMTVTMFLGITLLAQSIGVRVSEELHGGKSVLAQIGETVYDGGWPFIVLQVFTAGILVLAANTAFQDFPRLAAILARDGYMPSQFRNRGDRLVFSNGVLVLAAIAALLVWAFDAQLTRLIQLYVVGVFTAFTISQTGMVRKWLRERSEGWQRSAAINAVGAATTGVVLVVVTITKFSKGAWIVIVAMPLIVLFLLAVHRHYVRVGAVLRSHDLVGPGAPTNRFLLLVPDLGMATMSAVAYLRALRPTSVRPLWLGQPDDFASAADAWRERAPRLGELELLGGGHDRPVRALRDLLADVPRGEDDFVTVVVPEEVTSSTWRGMLRSRASFRIKAALLFERDVVVTDVPLVPSERAEVAAMADRPVEPERSVVIVPVASVHDGTIRAIRYASTLQTTAVEAICFATEPSEVADLVSAWEPRGMEVPLVFVEAPFRDFGTPLLAEIRRHTAGGDAVVTVVLPEFIPEHWWQNALHNQTAFYIKRLLLTEPHVVVTSVPLNVRHVRERASGALAH